MPYVLIQVTKEGLTAEQKKRLIQGAGGDPGALVVLERAREIWYE